LRFQRTNRIIERKARNAKEKNITMQTPLHIIFPGKLVFGNGVLNQLAARYLSYPVQKG
jgi:hypothetical protein